MSSPPRADIDARVHRTLVEQGIDGAGLQEAIDRLVRAEAPLLGGAAAHGVARRVAARVVGLGPLEPLLHDPAVTDVLVNGPGPVWVDRQGRLEATDVTVDRATVEHLIERIVAPLGLRADRTAPVVDARLPDGSRVNVVLPPLAVDGPCLTIRRFAARRVGLDAFAAPDVAGLLARAVARRWNLLVTGGTGAGKTTLLNALAACIDHAERVITIEDAAELDLPGDHVVRLEARPATADGVGEVRIRDLVRNALRMRPDRIVVGEVRGAEALDMLQAMNTGHEGSLSTCHANGPADGLRRIETMVLMADVELPHAVVRDHVRAAVDAVVHVSRGVDGRRRVTEVCEVASPEPGRTGEGAVAVRRLAGPSGVVATPTRPWRDRAGAP